MKKISRLLNYISEYKGKVALYFVTNLLGILFGLLTIVMIGPVLQTLFQTTVPVASGKPGNDLMRFFTDTVNAFIGRQDKMTGLAYICIAVV